MNKNQPENSNIRAFKTPFQVSTQNSTQNTFSDSKETKEKKENDWNIDYCLASTKEENPFSTKNVSNQAQIDRNLDFFFDGKEGDFHENEMNDENNGKKTYLYENEVEDDEMLMNLQGKKECLIYEEKGLSGEQENLNFDSKETLNLVESDNESKKDLIPIEKTYQKSIFQEKKEDFIKKVEIPIKSEILNQGLYEEIDLNQMENPISSRKIKDEDSLYESKLQMSLFPIFNFNFGWNFVQIKEEKTLLFSKEKLQDNHLAKILRDFPGPIKIEKNANYIVQTYNKLFNYINEILNFSDKNETFEGLCSKFAWNLLNEMLLNKKLSIYELLGVSTKFRDSLIIYIETHFLAFYDHSSININLEEFQNEANYLLNLINLTEEQYHDMIEDDQWETIFFAKLFLSSQKTQSLPKDVKDILTHYIERTYKKWFPMHVFTLLKLGKAEKFYEDSIFLNENPMLYVWLLLKISGFVEEEAWNSFLQILFYHLNERKKASILQFILLLMSLGFDNETLCLLIAQNNKPNMVQLLETFFFLANTLSNFQYDSPKFLYKNLFPAFLIHSNNLIENGLHGRAIEYVNLVESSKNFFFSLEKNRFFMNSLREIKQRLITNIEILYERKKSKNKDFSLILDNEKEGNSQLNLLQNTENINDFSTNLKRNFYNYFNSALGMIKNPLNEKSITKKPENQANEGKKDFYYDENLKTWVLNGIPAQNEEFEEKEKKTIEKPLISEEKPIFPPPMPLKKKEEAPILEKIDNGNEIKGGNTMRITGNNPFSNPFVNNDSDTTSEGSNPKQNRRVLQNRYVASYK